MPSLPGGEAGAHMLLRAALPHVPSQGFSLAAVQKAAEQSERFAGRIDRLTMERALERLFPGEDTAPTAAPRRLFQVWDDDACAKMAAQRDSHVTEISYQKAVQNAISLLRDRLHTSAAVRPHLMPVRFAGT